MVSLFIVSSIYPPLCLSFFLPICFKIFLRTYLVIWWAQKNSWEKDPEMAFKECFWCALMFRRSQSESCYVLLFSHVNPMAREPSSYEQKYLLLIKLHNSLTSKISKFIGSFWIFACKQLRLEETEVCIMCWSGRGCPERLKFVQNPKWVSKLSCELSCNKCSLEENMHFDSKKRLQNSFIYIRWIKKRLQNPFVFVILFLANHCRIHLSAVSPELI